MIKFILNLFGYNLIKKNDLNVVKDILNHCFSEIEYDYDNINDSEKHILSKREFDSLLKLMNE